MEQKHHAKEERTLVLVKPDAMQRHLVGEIIHRFERKGLKIIGIKMMRLNDSILTEHYAHHKDKPFFRDLANYMSSAPIIAMVISGIKAVSSVRTIVGPTKGYDAPAGTIRGDFSLSSQTNLVHASDPTEDPLAEVKRFFKEEDLFEYQRLDFDYIYGSQELE